MSLCKPAASLPWLADSLLCSLVGLCSLVASSPTLLGSVFWILHPQFGFIGDKNVRFLWSKMPLDLSNRIKCRMPEASATVVGRHPLLDCWFSTCNASCSIAFFISLCGASGPQPMELTLFPCVHCLPSSLLSLLYLPGTLCFPDALQVSGSVTLSTVLIASRSSLGCLLIVLA